MNFPRCKVTAAHSTWTPTSSPHRAPQIERRGSGGLGSDPRVSGALLPALQGVWVQLPRISQLPAVGPRGVSEALWRVSLWSNSHIHT